MVAASACVPLEITAAAANSSDRPIMMAMAIVRVDVIALLRRGLVG